MKKIAHLSDIQIRFGSRHDEYRIVFERTYKDLIEQKPDRILVTGDLNHNKINMSPISIDLAAEFLLNLSKIAPVDVIPGNHDLNLQQISQGDSIEPIVKLIENGFVVREDNKKKINFSYNKEGKNGIFYFPESGFYDITPDVVYGNYSCIDEKILTLEPSNKKKGKKYIALYHGTIYGSRNDNGYENKDTNLLHINAFNNFDIVALGDIHEYQIFREDESAAYAGSLIQQNFGESIDKGYLIWDLENNSHFRRYIINDYGFAKLNISLGESLAERIEHMKFSNDKRKTKVYIEYEDYEENYSVEYESQIKKLIKDKFGCETIHLNFVQKHRDKTLNLTEEEAELIKEKPIKEIFEDYFKEKKDQFDPSDPVLSDVINLAVEIDKILEIKPQVTIMNKWYLKKMEVSNIFSFPVEPIIFNFDKLAGLTGIFGQNYSGKSNVIRALVWGLYQSILGGTESSKLVNIYSGHNIGYVRLYIEMNGKYYRIVRTITRKKKRDGTFENSYSVEYTVLIETTNEDGMIEKKWEKEISDKATLEKSEVKKLIIDSIGTFDDFTKVSLQTQGGKEDYISQQQQPKNDLIRKYLGLEPYTQRYDYANKFFNDIKKKQKELGDYKDLEIKIQDGQLNIELQNKNLFSLEEEKRIANIKLDDLNNFIIELTSQLEKIEFLEENDLNVVETKIKNLKDEFLVLKAEETELAKWLKENFKKELPFQIKETPEQIQRNLDNKNKDFLTQKENYLAIKKWIEENPKKSEIDTTSLDSSHNEKNSILYELKNKLPLYRGESCPTCGHVHKQPQPDLEEKCKKEISVLTEEINSIKEKISEAKKIIQHNNTVDSKINTLKGMEVSIRSLKGEIEEQKKLLEQLLGMKDLVEHNKVVEQKTARHSIVKDRMDEIKHLGVKYKELISKINSNKEKSEKNEGLKVNIEKAKENAKLQKLQIFNLDQQITKLVGDIRVNNSELSHLHEKLKTIKEAENNYKKYSLYLQAVHRDGIPAQIIRKKLPIVNSKINSILKDIVEFKVSMEVLTNGDIVEYFFYNDDRSDAFPLSAASGSQKFIVSLAIKDALHYASNLTKPSLCIIDEGFGTLDEELRMKMPAVLYYLKNKYKNVLVVTHENVIKDFVEYVIEVSKTKKGIPMEYLVKYPNSWVTNINIR